MLLTVAGFLPLTITFDGFRVGGAVLMPVAGMFLAPLASALPACFAVAGIDCDLLAPITGTALLLAARLAADDLRRVAF